MFSPTSYVALAHYEFVVNSMPGGSGDLDLNFGRAPRVCVVEAAGADAKACVARVELAGRE